MSGEKKTAPINEGAENLKQLLERSLISTEDLAMELGIPVQIVNDWINGVGVPESQYTVKMARILGCKLREVYLAIIRTPLNNQI